jgi:hypothetical protein
VRLDGRLIENDTQALSLKDVEIKRRLSLLSYSSKKLWLYAAVLIVCVLVGYTLMHDGFKQWGKVQKATDDVLLKQASSTDS